MYTSRVPSHLIPILTLVLWNLNLGGSFKIKYLNNWTQAILRILFFLKPITNYYNKFKYLPHTGINFNLLSNIFQHFMNQPERASHPLDQQVCLAVSKKLMQNGGQSEPAHTNSPWRQEDELRMDRKRNYIPIH